MCRKIFEDVQFHNLKMKNRLIRSATWEGVGIMPFIIARVNVPVSTEQEREIKTILGRAIESVPGKSEKYLMLGIEDNCRFWLRGDNSQPAAYI